MTIRNFAPLLAVIAGACLAASGPAVATDTAAHALAEKFADGAEREEAKRRAAEAKRKADEAKRRAAAEEAEMLERARAEAVERKAAADKARAEAEAADARREEEERQEKAHRLAEEQRLAREKFIAEQLRAEEERRLAEEKKAAEEKRAEEERLAAEKRAQDERIAAEKQAAEEKRQAEESRLAAEKRAEEERIAAERRAAEERRLAEEQRAAEEKRIADQKRHEEEQLLAQEQLRAEEERQQRLAAEREAEHRNLTDKLLKLESERNAREALAEKEPMGLGAKPFAAAPSPAPPSVASSAPPSTRVTVLLVMEPGTNGIRRYGKKTADPVLCSGPTCWVSTGTASSAAVMTRGQALGPGNTLGRRAADCNQHLVCAFRGLDLKTASALVQPIDLRVMRHDRRQPLALEADRTCRISGGTLACDKVYATGTWRAWVVPEALAAEAGPAALEAALAGGLAFKTSTTPGMPL